MADNPKTSAKSVVRLIHTIKTSGQYYNKNIATISSTDSYDEQKAKGLWEGSEAIIGSKFLTL